MSALAFLEDLTVEYSPALVAASIAAVLYGIRHFLRTKRATRPTVGFESQLLLIGTILASAVAVFLAFPMPTDDRRDLVGIASILLSAAIALSSTTFLGNAMAGIMLRIVSNVRLGDWIRVEGFEGRVTEKGLLHTEIQTEDRDLLTLPNLFLVTHPVRVVRSSGTVVSCTVSLGYDVHHERAEAAMLRAAEDAELDAPFVHVGKLGDFSVTYRVAGVLTDPSRMITTRSNLRRHLLERLHADGIEIASPTVMTTRALDAREAILPETIEVVEEIRKGPDGAPAEEVVFDKAERAAGIEALRASLEEIDAEVAALDAGGSEGPVREAKLAELRERRAGVTEEIERQESDLRDAAD